MEVLLYLAKVSVCTGIFFILYHFVLSKFTFFSFNRWYLLITLIISFVIPFLTFQVERTVEMPRVSVAQNNIAISNTENSFEMDPEISFQEEGINIGLADFLNGVYALGVLYFFIRFINGLFQVIAKGRTHTKKDGLRYVLVPADSKLRNSSFFNYIFIDENLDEKVRQKVVAHEVIHLRKLHFIDKLLGNLSVCLLWFNPFVFAYLNAIDANHEFEVDAKSASNQSERSEYAQLILNLTQNSNNLIIHNFSKLPLKKRIDMLFKKSTNHMKKLIYLSVLPLIALCCLAFVDQKEVLVYVNSKSITKPFPSQEGLKGNDPLSKPEKVMIQKKSLDRKPIKTIKVRPKQRVLVIDPGHGGKDEASKSLTGIPEKAMTLRVALILQEEAEKRGIKVIKTREKDEFVGLYKRRDRGSEGDAFISLHFNQQSFIRNQPNPNSFRGIEVYTCSKSRASEKSIQEQVFKRSQDFGAIVLDALKDIKGIPVRESVQEQSLTVLTSEDVPSILIEIGNISFQDSFDFVNDENNLRKICNLILDGYDQFGKID